MNRDHLQLLATVAGATIALALIIGILTLSL